MKRTIVFIMTAIVFVLIALSLKYIATSQQGEQTQPQTAQEKSAEELVTPEFRCTVKNEEKKEKPTYLVGSSKLSREDIRRIEKRYGELIVPKDETNLAKTIRKQALARKKAETDRIIGSLQIWLKAHPNASAEEISQRRKRNELFLEQINSVKTRPEISLPAWDWRDQINVGAVVEQEEDCNNCWAIAATSAAACSLQKTRLRDDNYLYPVVTDDGELIPKSNAMCLSVDDPSPSLDDLTSCMSIKNEQKCKSGWHGRAFDFMVSGIGIPMAFPATSQISIEDYKRTLCYNLTLTAIDTAQCRPSAGYLRATSWDYVNSPPDKLPTVIQMKTALIEHGPLVAPIFMDKCFKSYRGGVFNENNKREINHVVLLIGWDDSKQAWLIKNSWGEEWGEKGFGWVKYGSNNIGQFAAWIDAG